MTDTLSFREALDHIFSDRKVPISQLYRLSDMSADEMAAFRDRWAGEDEARRRVIARHLADISEENFVVDFSPVFRLLLSDPSAAVRLAALDGLWDSTNTAVVTPVINLMQSDSNDQVRASAAATLGHYVLMGEWGQVNERVSNRIIDALLAQFDQAGTSEVVRAAVLESLGNAAHPRVPGLIDEAYEGGSDALQLSALYAMGRSADRRWVPAVQEAMNSWQAEMRLEAARAAGGIGDSDFVDRLIELLDDEELEVQLAAIVALGQIGSDQAYEVLRRVAANPEDEQLAEAAEAAMEEIEWLGGEIDLAMMDWDGAGDDDDDYDEFDDYD